MKHLLLPLFPPPRLALSFLAVFTAIPVWAAPKIPLAPWQVIMESGRGDAGLLVNEQTAAGDPAAGTGGAVTGRWNTGWNASDLPAVAVIDLRAVHQITHISVYDGSGSGQLTMSAGSGTGYPQTPIVTDGMAPYNQWRTFAVSGSTRFLRIQADHTDAIPTEVVVYGSLAPGQALEPEPAAQPHTPPPMEELIGVNALHVEPLGRLQAVGFVREYHDWQWDEGNTDMAYPGYPGNQNKFAPAYPSPGWDFDQFYGNLSRMKLGVVHTSQGSPPWLLGSGTSDGRWKPIRPGLGRSPSDPASYVEHADHLFQVAARYGSVTVADNLLKLAADQPRVSGQKTLRWIENWNEPDKWWAGREGLFRPEEYAAMSSADADGHRSALGTTLGLLQADPEARLVMAGITEPNLGYIKAIKLWCDFHRDGNFPFSALNIHHYCNQGGGQSSPMVVGISPEQDDLYGRMKAICDYRSAYLPGVEVWLSEFGYDTDPLKGSTVSDNLAPVIGTFSREEVQAQWILRSFFALAAAGVDRAMVFTLSDSDNTNPARFASSGLCRAKGQQWQPKPAWFYVATLRQRLKGLRFEAEQASGNPAVRIQRYKNSAGQTAALAVWCPTSNGTMVGNHPLTLPVGTTQATRVDFVDGQLFGTASPLAITNGTVSVAVSERPLLVLLGTVPAPPLPEERLILTAASLQMESGPSAAALVDEQNTAGNPLMGQGGAPTTGWSSAGTAIIDLGEPKKVTKVFLHDTNSSGTLQIYTGSAGNWTLRGTDKLLRWNSWSPWVLNEETRYLRLVKASGAQVNEVTVYIDPSPSVPTPTDVEGALLKYPFNQGGGTASNAGTAGAEGNLTLYPSLIWGANGSGVSGQINDYATLSTGANGSRASAPGTVTALNNLTALTITGWMKVPTWSNGRVILRQYASWGSGLTLRLGDTPGNLALCVARSSGDTSAMQASVNGGYDAAPGSWVFFAVTWDGGGTASGKVNFYRGGATTPAALVSTVARLGGVSTGVSTGTLHIGGDGPGGWSSLAGSLDGLRVYGSILNSTEIETVRQATAAGL